MYLSEYWAFWIPAFAGMTDLGAIFQALAREVAENRLSMTGDHKGRPYAGNVDGEKDHPQPNLPPSRGKG